MSTGPRILVGASLLWIALSAISDGVATLVLPVSLATAGGSVGELGLITFVGLVAGMLIQPIAGDMSDRLRTRLGRLPFLAIGVGLVIITLAGIAVADGPLAIGAAFLGLSVALSIAQAPQQALMPDLVAGPQRGRASGLKGLADLLGATAAFAVLGSLLAEGDVRPALAALAMTILVLFGLVVVLLRRSAPELVVLERPRRSLAEAFRIDASRDRMFVMIVAARFAFLLGIYAVGRFFVAYVASRLGLDEGPAAEVAGGVLALLALVTALGSLPAGVLSDRVPRVPLMVAGAASTVAGVASFALATDVPLMLIGGLAMAVGSALFGVASWATLIDTVPPAEAGRYLGIANFGTAGAAAVAGLAGPLINVGEATSRGAGFVLLFVAAATTNVVAAALATGIHRSTAIRLQPDRLRLEGGRHDRA